MEGTGRQRARVQRAAMQKEGMQRTRRMQRERMQSAGMQAAEEKRVGMQVYRWKGYKVQVCRGHGDEEGNDA